MRRSFLAWFLLSLCVLSHPASVMACAVCFGEADTPLARGLHWGVIALLGIVLAVLGAIAGFFVYLAKRSAALASSKPAEAAANHVS